MHPVAVHTYAAVVPVHHPSVPSDDPARQFGDRMWPSVMCPRGASSDDPARQSAWHGPDARGTTAWPAATSRIHGGPDCPLQRMGGSSSVDESVPYRAPTYPERIIELYDSFRVRPALPYWPAALFICSHAASVTHASLPPSGLKDGAGACTAGTDGLPPVTWP